MAALLARLPVADPEDGTGEDVRPHVLVVDDMEPTRFLVGAILEPAYRVSTACDGNEAITLAQRDRPDVVVTDVLMPGMDGRSLVRALRRDPRTEDIPVVFLTILESDEDLSAGLGMGANDYLAKPFRPAELRARVGSLLRDARVQRERRASDAELLHARRHESLGALAGGVAHSFNNLLGIILGNAEILGDYLPPDSPAREHIDAIAQTVSRARGIASQMLTYSGREHARLELFDLTQVTQDGLDLLLCLAGDGVELVWEPCRQELQVYGDPGQLQRVLRELVSNAIEALGKKPGRVTVETSQVAADDLPEEGFLAGLDRPVGQVACLRVSDSGCGIADEIASQAFDPFLSTGFCGRGLGLAAVLGIVRACGGALHVHTRPGEGTAIRVLLPLS